MPAAKPLEREAGGEVIPERLIKKEDKRRKGRIFKFKGTKEEAEARRDLLVSDIKLDIATFWMLLGRVLDNESGEFDQYLGRLYDWERAKLVALVNLRSKSISEFDGHLWDLVARRKSKSLVVGVPMLRDLLDKIEDKYDEAMSLHRRANGGRRDDFNPYRASPPSLPGSGANIGYDASE